MSWLSFFGGAACMAVILNGGILVWLATFRKNELLKVSRNQKEYESAILSQLIERTGLEMEQNRILTRLCEVVLLASREK